MCRHLRSDEAGRGVRPGLNWPAFCVLGVGERYEKSEIFGGGRDACGVTRSIRRHATGGLFGSRLARDSPDATLQSRLRQILPPSTRRMRQNKAHIRSAPPAAVTESTRPQPTRQRCGGLRVYSTVRRADCDCQRSRGGADKLIVLKWRREGSCIHSVRSARCKPNRPRRACGRSHFQGFSKSPVGEP